MMIIKVMIRIVLSEKRWDFDILQEPIQFLIEHFTLLILSLIPRNPLKEITDLSKLPKPTVYRILSSLELWGYVDQTVKRAIIGY